MWAPAGSAEFPLDRQLDKVLRAQGCVYYPEEEWRTHNMRPPDTQPLVAAWRDVAGHVFIFLLEGSASRRKSSQFVVLVAGIAERVKSMGRSINAIKQGLEKSQRDRWAGERAERQLDTESRRKPVKIFAVVIGIFTAVVNAVSFYFRRVVPPQFSNEQMHATYLLVVSATHIAAVVLLLLVILIGIAYALKFAALILRSGP